MSARGEGTIQVNDSKEVPILFTNRALGGAERDLGRGVISVVQSFSDGGSINDVAILLQHGMQAANRDAGIRQRVTLPQAYEVLDEAGFATVAAAVMESVAAVLGYTPDDDILDQNGQPDPNE